MVPTVGYHGYSETVGDSDSRQRRTAKGMPVPRNNSLMFVVRYRRRYHFKPFRTNGYFYLFFINCRHTVTCTMCIYKYPLYDLNTEKNKMVVCPRITIRLLPLYSGRRVRKRKNRMYFTRKMRMNALSCVKNQIRELPGKIEKRNET